jgi:uncharacterized membrane protein
VTHWRALPDSKIYLGDITATIRGALSMAGGNWLERIAIFLETHDGQRLSISVFSIIATLILLGFPGTLAAFAFGIPLIFFVPGFAVVRLVFWRGTSVEAKFVLSLGLSVLVVIFLGLFLVLTIGLDATTTRASLIVFALGAVALERFWFRADREPRKKKQKEESKDKAAKKPAPEPEPFKIDKVVAAMLCTALVISAISLGMIVTAKYPSRTYIAITENGSADINSARLNNSIMMIDVKMHNGEDGVRNFSLNVHEWNHTIFGSRWYNRTMEKGGTWNITVVFNLDTAGTWRLDFDLWIQENGKPPYLYSDKGPHLWIEVT